MGAASGQGGDMAGYFLSLSIPFTLMVLGFGGFLLHDSVSTSGPAQLQEVIGGALLLALGLIAAYPQLRFAIRRMQDGRLIPLFAKMAKPDRDPVSRQQCRAQKR